jgi:hypothetical protein
MLTGYGGVNVSEVAAAGGAANAQQRPAAISPPFTWCTGCHRWKMHVGEDEGQRLHVKTNALAGSITGCFNGGHTIAAGQLRMNTGNAN